MLAMIYVRGRSRPPATCSSDPQTSGDNGGTGGLWHPLRIFRGIRQRTGDALPCLRYVRKFSPRMPRKGLWLSDRTDATDRINIAQSHGCNLLET